MNARNCQDKAHAFASYLEKLADRKERGVIVGEGDDR